MTTPNTPNTAERPRRVLWLSRLDVEEMEDDGSRSAQIDAYRECGDWEPGYLCFQEIDSHRHAESVSAAPAAVPGAVWIYGSVSLVAHGSEEEWVRKRNAARLYLCPQPSSPGAVSDEDARRAMEAYRDAFKNFHRSLCARFGYTHDELFWWRDLVSLEEHIAKLAAPPAQAVSVGVPESVRYAVERMSIDPTWLKGVTAQEDARCMLIIADFISSLSAAPAAVTREGKE